MKLKMPSLEASAIAGAVALILMFLGLLILLWKAIGPA